jgi:hypothetical protein
MLDRLRWHGRADLVQDPILAQGTRADAIVLSKKRVPAGNEPGCGPSVDEPSATGHLSAGTSTAAATMLIPCSTGSNGRASPGPRELWPVRP